MQKKLIVLLTLFVSVASHAWTPRAVKIWDNDNYSAFTSLCKYKGKYYCAFREAGSHIYEKDGSAHGQIRILVSRNGRKWKNSAVLTVEGTDLRDPKLSVGPDGKLMLIMGGSYYSEWTFQGRTTHVAFSEDGSSWTAPQKVRIKTDYAEPDNWIWRVTWYEGTGYGVSYSSSSSNLYLLKSKNGIDWEQLSLFTCGDFPNETTIRFTDDGEMCMIVRCDGENDSRAYWGKSSYPYTSVNLQPLDFRIGGPDMLLLDGGKVIVAGRSYDKGMPCRTSIWTGTLNGDFTKVLDLPSGMHGDTSYPGMIVKGNKLLITWYAGIDEGTADIWFSKIPLSRIVNAGSAKRNDSFFITRGIVLSTKELSEVDWPGLAAANGINTIGTHVTPAEVAAFLETSAGQHFLGECKRHGITVEHHLHAMSDLLPRELFSKDSTMFRMDASGRRTPEGNCCVHSEKALKTITSNAIRYAKSLRPGNHRYYFWMDDNAPSCACPLCRDYLPSEQALIVENRMLRAIRKVDRKAKLAHLAYSLTMEPPGKVKPDDGIFLEFAPINRSWNEPLRNMDAVSPYDSTTNGDIISWLEANLEVFPAADAMVLEYWLDASMFSRWQRPSIELPWQTAICRSDLETYAGYGLRNITSFAVYMDADYFERFPTVKPVTEYGKLLNSFKLYTGLNDPWDEMEDKTRISVCNDGSEFHICFEVQDTTLVVCDSPGERSVDHGDRVEVFLSCDPGMNLYYGFEIDPDGKVMDYRNSFYRQFDYDWTGELNVCGTRTQKGYRAEVHFDLDYLRQLGVVQEDGSVLAGLFRADAVEPDDIIWYSLIDPHTPEPDFHVPGSLFPLD